MTIVVEFFGIPRRRAEVAQAELQFSSEHVTLGALLESLAARFPGLADDCLLGGRLRGDCSVNLDGEQFVRDPKTRLYDGQHVLLMSADAGG